MRPRRSRRSDCGSTVSIAPKPRRQRDTENHPDDRVTVRCRRGFASEARVRATVSTRLSLSRVTRTNVATCALARQLRWLRHRERARAFRCARAADRSNPDGRVERRDSGGTSVDFNGLRRRARPLRARSETRAADRNRRDRESDCGTALSLGSECRCQSCASRARPTSFPPPSASSRSDLAGSNTTACGLPPACHIRRRPGRAASGVRSFPAIYSETT